MDLVDDFNQMAIIDEVLTEDTRVVYHSRMSRTDEGQENNCVVKDCFLVHDQYVNSDRGPYIFTRTEDAQKVRVMYFDCTVAKGKKPLRCTICWCVFEKYGGLLTHWKKQHSKDQASGYVMAIDCEVCHNSFGQPCRVTWMLETDPDADLRDHRQMRRQCEIMDTGVISKRFLHKLGVSIDTKWREQQKIDEQRFQANELKKQRRQRHLQHLDNRARPKFEPCPWPCSKPQSNDNASLPSAKLASLPPSFLRKRRRRNRTNSGVVRIDDGADEGSRAKENQTAEAECRTNASGNVAVLRRNSSENLDECSSAKRLKGNRRNKKRK